MYAFETMRPLQVEVIDKVVEAFEEFDFVMVEMPTGTGKSGVAMSVALSINDHEPTSYINTSSKLLQDQYLHDFAYTKTVKGRNNFNCTDPYTDPRIRAKCDTAACVRISGYPCSVKPQKQDFVTLSRGFKNEFYIYKGTIDKDLVCPYFKQKFIGLQAGHVISNYKYFFSLYYYTGELGGRDLLVFDEAHNIEGEIFDFVSLTITPNYYGSFAKKFMSEMLKSKGVTVPDAPLKTDSIIIWAEYLRQTVEWMEAVWKYYDMDKKIDRYENVPKEVLYGLDEETVKLFLKFGDALKKAKHIHSLISKDYTNWIVDFNLDVKGKILSTKISPIETGDYVKDIFTVAKKTLFISATLLDKAVFADMIGIPADKIAFIRIDQSPFPVSNRQIHLENVGSLSYKSMDRMLPKVAACVDKILSDHPFEKGIIHCTNYSQVNYIKNNISVPNKERLTITQSGTQQSDIMDIHKLKENSVLLSPSMAEGVDLKDSLSRFQIIVKVPYLPLSDKRIKKKMTKSPAWYEWHACLKLMQSYGRSVRSDDDYAVTYILDSKVKDLIDNKLITPWFKEAIVV